MLVAGGLLAAAVAALVIVIALQQTHVAVARFAVEPPHIAPPVPSDESIQPPGLQESMGSTNASSPRDSLQHQCRDGTQLPEPSKLPPPILADHKGGYQNRLLSNFGVKV